MNGKMTPEKARALRDEVVKGHRRRHPSAFAPQPGTLKHRELRLAPSHAEQLPAVRKLLEGLQGLVVTDGRHPHALTIWYEVTDYTLPGLEQAVSAASKAAPQNARQARLFRLGFIITTRFLGLL